MLGGKSKRLSPLFKIREDLPPIIGVLPKAFGGLAASYTLLLPKFRVFPQFLHSIAEVLRCSECPLLMRCRYLFAEGRVSPPGLATLRHLLSIFRVSGIARLHTFGSPLLNIWVSVVRRIHLTLNLRIGVRRANACAYLCPIGWRRIVSEVAFSLFRVRPSSFLTIGLFSTVFRIIPRRITARVSTKGHVIPRRAFGVHSMYPDDFRHVEFIRRDVLRDKLPFKVGWSVFSDSPMYGTGTSACGLRAMISPASI